MYVRMYVCKTIDATTARSYQSVIMVMALKFSLVFLRVDKCHGRRTLEQSSTGTQSSDLNRLTFSNSSIVGLVVAATAAQSHGLLPLQHDLLKHGEC
jgi:hypothetical protein